MTSPSSARSDQAPIRVTAHALERARERHPDLRPLGERDLLRTICREVGSALRNHRVAKTAPAETLDTRYTVRQKASRGDRYAWNAARSRVYLLRQRDGHHLVVTVMATSR